MNKIVGIVIYILVVTYSVFLNAEHIPRIGKERLTFQNSWTYVSDMEEKKDYTALVSMLEKELNIINIINAKLIKGQLLSEEDCNDIKKIYKRFGSTTPIKDFLARNQIDPYMKYYDLEGKLYILDDLAEIHSRYLIDFSKAKYFNKLALETYANIDKISISNIPVSDYYNKRRSLFYCFYPLNSKAIDDINGHGQSFRRIKNEEKQFFGRLDLATLFPSDFINIVRLDDFERVKHRINNRVVYLNKKLGLSQDRTVKNLAIDYDIQEVKDFLEKQGLYNIYYKYWLLSSIMWSKAKSEVNVDYNKLVNYCNKAIGHKKNKMETDVYSYNMLNYWLGISYLKMGEIMDGLHFIESFFQGLDKTDLQEIEDFKYRMEVLKALDKEKIKKAQMIQIIGAIISAGIQVAGTTISIEARFDYSNYNEMINAGQNADIISSITQMANDIADGITTGISSSAMLGADLKNLLKNLMKPRFLKVARYLNKFEQVDLYVELSKNYKNNGLNKEAIMYLEDALSIIEMQRSTISSETQKISFADLKEELYSELISLLIKNKDYERAFKYVERAKARALLDVLGSNKVVLKNTDETEQFSSVMNGREEASELLDPDNLSIYRIGSVANRIGRGLELVSDNASNIGLANLSNMKTISFKYTKEMSKSDYSILEYFVANDAVYIFLFDNGSFYIEEVHIQNKELFDLVKSYRENVAKSEGGVTYEGANKLYNLLIKPLRGKITKKRIFIIPHRWLHYIPFQALNDGNKYLVEDFAITNAPSATVLNIWLEKECRSKGSICILGNPDLGDAKYNLQYGETEAMTIGTNFKDKRIFIGNEATETNFKEQAGSYDIIHIAAHGFFDANNPLKSAILLAEDQENDGLLQATEFYQMSLNANLLTFSACETGLSYVSKGDEMIGLLRGAMYAGVNSMLSSLWKVNDMSTALLMIKFYKNLATMPKDLALQKAQKETLIQTPVPFAWAPFVLTGNNN